MKSQKFQADRKIGYMILSLNHINAVQTLLIRKLTHIYIHTYTYIIHKHINTVQI